MTNEGPQQPGSEPRPSHDPFLGPRPEGPPAPASPFGLGDDTQPSQAVPPAQAPPSAQPWTQAAPASQPTSTYPAHPGYGAAPQASDARAAKARRRFAAGIVAAALVVGGGAGVGGAAAWDAFHGDGTTSGSRSSVAQASSASDSIGASSAAADGSVESVAAKVLPSVVKIDVSGSQGAGSGSGIILSADGRILTNNHVVELAGDGGSIRVFFNDGSSADATVVGTDPLTDTALIQATDVSGLTAASIGTSGDLEVGQGVVAIGSPYGLESTVTSGIVSALDRPVDVGSDTQGNATVYPAIQTDAAINPGNSGGALVDLAGNVVGINSSIRTSSSSSTEESGSIGLGFAIPIDEVLPIIEQMSNGQTPTHARMGVSVSDVGATAPQQQQDQGQGLNPFGQQQEPQQQQVLPTSEGAQVQEVTAGSTAANAGIAAGDVITKVDDQLISGSDSLVATIRSYRPGDQVTVTFTQGGETKTAQLTLDSDASASAS